MKRTNIYKYFLWLFTVTGLFLILGFVNKENSSISCKSLIINIDDKNGNEFITKEDVLDMLSSNKKYPVGKRLKNINIGMLEKLVNSNPFVSNAEVYSTFNGELVISITQRNPVIRIINTKNEHFYIDETGTFMPVSQNYSVPVIVANGYLYNTFAEGKIDLPRDEELNGEEAKSMLGRTFMLARYINKDTLWNAQIQQIYVNELSEIILIPRVGNHKIFFGDAADFDEKFEKLLIFYMKGCNKAGWNNYSDINLKYRNQIVCTKAPVIKNEKK